MRFSNILAGVVALASAVVAQSNTLQFRGVPNLVQAGDSVTINYVSDDINSPVTITLRKGPSGNLNTVDTITSTATGGSFVWNVDDSIEDGADYALQITQGSEINYTGPFTIAGGNAPGQSSSASASASTSASDSSSSASASASTTGSSSGSVTTTVSGSTSLPTGGNSTTILSTRASPTATRTTATSGSEPSSAPTPDAASGLKSPLALVFGAVVAMAYLN